MNMATQSHSTPTTVVDGLLSVAAHLEPELDEALAEHRLTRPSFQVLSALLDAERNALTQRELMATVRRTSGTMSVRLARLERAGLVTREPDPDDRRTVTVTLTDRGREWAEAARPAYDEAADRLATGLPDEARAAFGEYLAAWLEFFEPDDRVAPRLGVAVAPAAVASRMRRAVGLTERPGVLVLRVKRSSAADTAGLQRGDLVVGAGGRPVRSIGDLDRAVRKARTKLALDLVRGVDERSVEVALGNAGATLAED
jgi:DNA-binding MarR family transcriptional regulator